MTALNPLRPRVATGRDHALSAGLADVVVASLCSLVAGVYATSVLPTARLGVWGIMFSAFLLASVVPTELVFAPAEAATAALAVPNRLRAVTPVMGAALVPAVVASLVALALAAAVTTGSHLDGNAGATAAQLAAVTFPLCVSAPMQDHLRRVLHQSGWSVGAVLTSAVQLVAVVGLLVALHRSSLDRLLVPSVALGAASIVSVLAGVALTRHRAGPARRSGGDTRAATVGRVGWVAAPFGRWPLAAAAADRLGQFGCVCLLATWAGDMAVGRFEAARVATQPVVVGFSLGLLTLLRSPLLRWARSGDAARAIRCRRGFGAVVVMLGTVYAAFMSVPVSSDLVEPLVPAAFERPGFLAAVVASTTATAMLMTVTTEVVSGGRAGAYSYYVILAAVVLVAACAVAMASGAGVFAWPIAVAVRAGVLGVLLSRTARALYPPAPRLAARS